MIEILNTFNQFEGILEVKYKRFVGCVEALKSRFGSPPYSQCPLNWPEPSSWTNSAAGKWEPFEAALVGADFPEMNQNFQLLAPEATVEMRCLFELCVLTVENPSGVHRSVLGPVQRSFRRTPQNCVLPLLLRPPPDSPSPRQHFHRPAPLFARCSRSPDLRRTPSAVLLGLSQLPPSPPPAPPQSPPPPGLQCLG